MITLQQETARTTRRNKEIKLFSMSCFFCEFEDDPVKLHACQTLTLHNKIKDIAGVLGDTAVLAKLSQRDMIAIKAKYHNKCLVSYNNKFRSRKKIETASGTKDKLAYG